MLFDFQMYLMLRYLPGYTWQTLEAEDDWTFDVLWECVKAERSAGGGNRGF